MPYTNTFNIDAAGNPEPVTVDSVCKEVTVYENAQAGTTDYDVYAPLITSTPARRPAGAKTTFTAPGKSFFQPGQVIAYLAAATAGSYVFAKEEN